MAKWFAYAFMCFSLTLIFTGATVLIWWAAQFGYWWGLLGTAVTVGIVGGTLLAIGDPAKVDK